MGIGEETFLPPPPEVHKSSEKEETLNQAVHYIEAVRDDTYRLKGDDNQFVEETKNVVYQTANAVQNADRTNPGYREVIPRAEDAVNSIQAKIINLETTCEEFGVDQNSVSEELIGKLKQILASDNQEQISRLTQEADQIFLMNINHLTEERDQQKLQRHLLFKAAEENYEESRYGLIQAVDNLQKDISGGRVDYFVQTSRRLFDQLNQTCSLMITKESQYQNHLNEYQHYFSQLMDSLIQQPDTDSQVTGE